MTVERPVGGFRLRSLVLPVYLPTVLFAIGQGAVIPVTPLFARDLGGSLALAGLVVSLRGFGTMIFDVPAGLLVGRIGERGAMIVATLALVLVAIGAGLSPSVWVFAGLVFVMGCAWAVWMLARLAFVSELAPVEVRGRALSLVGGSQRIGNFAGPFLGGFAADAFGLQSAFFVQAALAGLAWLALVAVTGREGEGRPAAHEGGLYQRLGRVVSDHGKVFLTAGSATTAISVLRASRTAVIPLWGDELGLTAGDIGVIFGISAAMDMTLFYPVGIVMDSWGRKWVGVPCMLLMACGMLVIPLTSDFPTLLGASALISLGNGFGSGIVMTLGADFSPQTGRGEFLGVWRLVSDIGTAGGPTVVGLVAGAASLGAAAVVTGGVGLVGAAVLVLLVPEPLRRERAPASTNLRLPGRRRGRGAPFGGQGGSDRPEP